MSTEMRTNTIYDACGYETDSTVRYGTVLYCIHENIPRVRINSSTVNALLIYFLERFEKQFPAGKKLLPRISGQASETACQDPDQQRR
jgi:hypothetical protein